MPKFSEIPGSPSSELLSITVTDRQTLGVTQHQVPGYTEVADFLQVMFGKAARKSSILLSDKRAIAMLRKKSWEIVISA